MNEIVKIKMWSIIEHLLSLCDHWKNVGKDEISLEYYSLQSYINFVVLIELKPQKLFVSRGGGVF